MRAVRVTRTPFDGEVMIADASAITRAEKSKLASALVDAINAWQIVTCEIVTLELLRSARNRDEVEEREASQSTFHHVPVTRSVQRAALTALRELARRGAGYHRVPVPDLLIAAAAQEAGVGVLHYDHHFDRLAEVLHFASVWLAPAGSLS
jgi:predicted nucleic acid-binding protein